jgi:hypothetical protein
MENNLKILLNELEYHRNNKNAFLYKLFKDSYFDIKSFNDLITLINKIKILFK